MSFLTGNMYVKIYSYWNNNLLNMLFDICDMRCKTVLFWNSFMAVKQLPASGVLHASIFWIQKEHEWSLKVPWQSVERPSSRYGELKSNLSGVWQWPGTVHLLPWYQFFDFFSFESSLLNSASNCFQKLKLISQTYIQKVVPIINIFCHIKWLSFFAFLAQINTKLKYTCFPYFMYANCSNYSFLRLDQVHHSYKKRT